jgi:hypothetical protein
MEHLARSGCDSAIATRASIDQASACRFGSAIACTDCKMPSISRRPFAISPAFSHAAVEPSRA